MKFENILIKRWLSPKLKMKLSLAVFLILFIFILVEAVFGQEWLGYQSILGSNLQNETSAFLIAVLLAVGLSLLSSAKRGSGNDLQVDFNFVVPSQRRMIARSINSCQNELIIFSGQFRSTIYGSDEVLEALRRLKTKNVTLYCRDEEIDPASIDLVELCRERNWKIHKNLQSNQAHFIVVDRYSCRIEFPSNDDDGDQLAVYYAGRPDYCMRLLRSFVRNVSKRRPDISVSDLPSIS